MPLTETPENAELALSWALDLWGDHIPTYSRQDWANFYSTAREPNFKAWSGGGQELIFIAKRGEEILGTISLVDFDDLEEFRHLSPWIAAFIVNPHMRGTGIGTQILDLLEIRATDLGISTLYLWTEDQSTFYAKRGYELLASSLVGDIAIDIMRKKLIAR